LKITQKFIAFSAFAGIFASIVDVCTMFIFGMYFPGYSQLEDTVSMLGSSISPVSNQISTIWVIIGVLLILFGIGFHYEFEKKGIYSKISSWLIILYGFGEGIGSGVFKADRISNNLTTSAIFHEILGGIGIVSILLLPLFMQKVIPKKENPELHLMSQLVFYSGIVFILLFLFRFSADQTGIISIYKGLWQRVFILISYTYLIRIAILMISRWRKRQKFN